MAVIELYNIKQVYPESYMTNLSLPVTGILHGRPWRFSLQFDETGGNHNRGGYESVYGWGNSRILLFEAATNML